MSSNIGCKLQMPLCHQWLVHLKVGDCSCRTIGLISLVLPTVPPTAEKKKVRDPPQDAAGALRGHRGPRRPPEQDSDVVQGPHPRAQLDLWFI